MAKKAGELPLNQLSMIAESTVLEGTLRARGDVQVSGRVIGRVEATSRVMVASAGVVEGTVVAVAANIAGEVQGDLDVDHHLVLFSSARVDGSIEAGKLVIEEGAVFNGSCRIVPGKGKPLQGEASQPFAPPVPSFQQDAPSLEQTTDSARRPSEPSGAPAVSKGASGQEGGTKRTLLALLGVLAVSLLATGTYYSFGDMEGTGESRPGTADNQAPGNSETPAEARAAPLDAFTGGAVSPSSDTPAAALPDAPILDDPAQQTAGLDRIAMEYARRRVFNRRSEPRVATLYQQAAVARQAGLDQADAGHFEQAARSYRTARRLFVRMGEVLGEVEDASEQGPPLDTATVVVAEAAAGDSATASAETPADTLVGALAEAVGEEPAPEVSEEEAAATRAAVEAALRNLARELKLAIEQEDAASMQALYYRGWAPFFEEAEAITAIVRPEDVQVNGAEATARVALDLTYRDAENQSQRRTQVNRWTLMRLGEEWILRRVSSP